MLDPSFQDGYFIISSLHYLVPLDGTWNKVLAYMGRHSMLCVDMQTYAQNASPNQWNKLIFPADGTYIFPF
jgi:hypothetical protein